MTKPKVKTRVRGKFIELVVTQIYQSSDEYIIWVELPKEPNETKSK